MITKRAVLFLTILLLIGCSEKKQKTTPALKSSSSEIVNLKEYLIPLDNIIVNSRVDIWKDSNGDMSYTFIEILGDGDGDGLAIIYTGMDSNFELINVWKDLVKETGLYPLDSYSRECIECSQFKFQQNIGHKTIQEFYNQFGDKILWTQEFRGVEDSQAIFDNYFIVNDGELEYHQIYYFSKGIGLTRFESGDFSSQLVKTISEEEFFQ